MVQHFKILQAEFRDPMILLHECVHASAFIMNTNCMDLYSNPRLDVPMTKHVFRRTNVIATRPLVCF